MFQKMKVKSNAKWKSLPMSHNFFTAGMDQVERWKSVLSKSAQAVCGGIEELTDYTLVLKGNKSGKVRVCLALTFLIISQFRLGRRSSQPLP